MRKHYFEADLREDGRTCLHCNCLPGGVNHLAEPTADEPTWEVPASLAKAEKAIRIQEQHLRITRKSKPTSFFWLDMQIIGLHLLKYAVLGVFAAFLFALLGPIGLAAGVVVAVFAK